MPKAQKTDAPDAKTQVQECSYVAFPYKLHQKEQGDVFDEAILHACKAKTERNKGPKEVFAQQRR